MRLLSLLIAAAFFSPVSFAQLSTEQKRVDFEQLVALFAKRYAFYEWKQQAIPFDGLKLKPWMDRINSSKDDIDYFEMLQEYVASYQDSHTQFYLPSTFVARLGFTVDRYDGKLLIDSIDRKVLAASDFPFQVGDQLVTLDGTPAEDVASGLAKLSGQGNPRTGARIAAGRLTTRYQESVPRAFRLGDSAQIVINRRGGGAETYTVPWVKSGTPYTMAGPVPTPTRSVQVASDDGTAIDDAPPATPFYMARVKALQVFKTNLDREVVGEGALAPIFAVPDGFVQRLGSGRYDTLFTGTYQAGGKNIGYLRLGSFGFVSDKALESELAYLQAHTDGLVVDMMHNPGGYGCVAEDLAQHLMPVDFHSLGQEFRPTFDLILGLQSDVEYAQQYGTSDDVATVQHLLDVAKAAYADVRGFTYPEALCGSSKDIPASRDSNGNVIAYTKPMMVLVDEMSASAAELFTAILQDNQRPLIYGMRTAGAGGAVTGFDVGYYTEGYANMAFTILVRKLPINTAEYPAAAFIENIGVLPDKTDDYMTADNLLNQGKPFVTRFTAAMVNWINSQQ